MTVFIKRTSVRWYHTTLRCRCTAEICAYAPTDHRFSVCVGDFVMGRRRLRVCKGTKVGRLQFVDNVLGPSAWNFYVIAVVLLTVWLIRSLGSRDDAYLTKYSPTIIRRSFQVIASLYRQENVCMSSFTLNSTLTEACSTGKDGGYDVGRRTS